MELIGSIIISALILWVLYSAALRSREAEIEYKATEQERDEFMESWIAHSYENRYKDDAQYEIEYLKERARLDAQKDYK